MAVKKFTKKRLNKRVRKQLMNGGSNTTGNPEGNAKPQFYIAGLPAENSENHVNTEKLAGNTAGNTANGGKALFIAETMKANELIIKSKREDPPLKENEVEISLSKAIGNGMGMSVDKKHIILETTGKIIPIKRYIKYLGDIAIHSLTKYTDPKLVFDKTEINNGDISTTSNGKVNTKNNTYTQYFQAINRTQKRNNPLTKIGKGVKRTLTALTGIVAGLSVLSTYPIIYREYKAIELGAKIADKWFTEKINHPRYTPVEEQILVDMRNQTNDKKTLISSLILGIIGGYASIVNASVEIAKLVKGNPNPNEFPRDVLDSVSAASNAIINEETKNKQETRTNKPFSKEMTENPEFYF
jgi:hypothetical protein